MLVTCEEMSQAEQRFFSGSASAENYMNEAGRQCAFAIRQFFPTPSQAEIFCGPGNNGGDALVIARWLRRWGWKLQLHFSHEEKQLSELAQRKLEEFKKEAQTATTKLTDLSKKPLVLIDGLLGIGAKGQLRGDVRELALRLEALRKKEYAKVFSIDIPTGLDADTGKAYVGAIKADYTFSITAPKTGFAADTATEFLGRLIEIPLDIPVQGADSIRFLFPSNLRARLIRRSFDSHKGLSGRVTLVAGSRGFTGAAVLSAMGASQIGAGLTTLCVSEDIYSIVAAQCPPEIMLRSVENVNDILEGPLDVLALGPGLGAHALRAEGNHKKLHPQWDEALKNLPVPMILDADALNALAHCSFPLESLPENRLLTPHPRELQRLSPLEGSRVEVTRTLAEKWGLTLLHKGARTAVATPGHPLELNTTGHPGMASGGMGDVLTGVCAGLAAQGYSLHDSASIGSWVLGRAAEIVRDSAAVAEESVTAVKVVQSLGAALRDLQTSCY